MPNPNRGEFEIRIFENTEDVFFIEILNGLNQQVRQLQVEHSKSAYHVNLYDLSGGVYLVRIVTNNGDSMTRKLILLK